jgi:hypothetical protein
MLKPVFEIQKIFLRLKSKSVRFQAKRFENLSDVIKMRNYSYLNVCDFIKRFSPSPKTLTDIVDPLDKQNFDFVVNCVGSGAKELLNDKNIFTVSSEVVKVRLKKS